MFRSDTEDSRFLFLFDTYLDQIIPYIPGVTIYFISLAEGIVQKCTEIGRAGIDP